MKELKPMNERVAEILEEAHVQTRPIRQLEGGDGYHCIDCKRPLDFCKCRAVTRPTHGGESK